MTVTIAEGKQSNSAVRIAWYAVAFALSYAGVYAMVAWLVRWAYVPIFNLFLSLLIVSFVVCEIGPVRVWLAGVLHRLSAFLRRRGSFSSAAVVEAPKFALLRVLFGAFMMQRCLWILAYLQPSDWARAEVWLLVIIYLAAAGMVTIGFMTQPALLFLVLVQWQIGDQILATSTLGNDIAAMLAILLLFANGGAHLSIDGWLMRQKGAAGKMIAQAYYENGLPSDDTLQIVKFLTLAAYWLVCVYSLSMRAR